VEVAWRLLTDSSLIGAGILSSGTSHSLHLGNIIIVAGLIIQILSFMVFMLLSLHFCIRIGPLRHSSVVPWRKHLYNLYSVSLLILVRSIFRVIEYAQGWDGSIFRHEAWMFVFDSMLMVVAVIAMNAIHPSELLEFLGKNVQVREMEVEVPLRGQGRGNYGLVGEGESV
jgi:hypothetical protein